MRVRVGSDIVCIDRFRSVLQRRGLGFLSRFLSIDEVSYAIVPNKLIVVRDCVEAGTGLAGALSSLDLSDVKLPRVCGFWAAKEAFVKALGCGIGSSVGFSDIEIFKDDAGCPFVRFPKEGDFNVSGTSISISHDGNFAICNCIIVYDD